jgi:signal transduction histidine kinase
MAVGGGDAGGSLSYEQVEHELKTPLASMRSLSEIMLDHPDLSEEERRRFLEAVVGENERLARTVERVLGLPGIRRALAGD